MKRLPLLLQVLRQPERLGAASLGDWDLLLLQAGSARLLGALRRLLEEHGLMGQVPPEARTHLDWSQMLSERHRRAVHWEVEQIRRALARLALRPILLKGGAYALAGLPPANGRLFTDIDILVPKDRLDEVEAALMMHGWISSHGDAYDQRYYREWMHELPPMRSLRRGTVIDVHHAILPETAPVRPDPAKLRAAARPIPGDSDFQTLAPADMVLHSATHLFYGEFEHGLCDLVDIDRLLRHFGEEPGFWDGLGARARELALGRPLFYALRMAAPAGHRGSRRGAGRQRARRPGPGPAGTDGLAVRPCAAAGPCQLQTARQRRWRCTSAPTGCACRRCCWRATSSTRPLFRRKTEPRGARFRSAQ